MYYMQRKTGKVTSGYYLFYIHIHYSNIKNKGAAKIEIVSKFLCNCFVKN